MREISASKQKIFIIGFIGIIILVIVMMVVMFSGKSEEADNIKVIDNTQGAVDNKEIQKVPITGNKDNNKPVNKLTTGTLTKLIEGGVFGLQIKKGTNQAMFYQDKNVLTVDPFTGKKHSLGGYPFVNLIDMQWSVNNKAIVVDYDTYFIYDLNTGLTERFRESVDTAIWNKTGDKVIYKYYNSESHKRKIRIANIDGTDSKLIVDNLEYRDIELTLQKGSDKICYFLFPDARLKGVLACVNLDGKDKKEYGGQYGQDYLWSPNGSKILTSFTKEQSGDKMVLGVINKNGGGAKGLSFSTVVKKCVWSKNNIDIYCAALGGAPEGVMMPNIWNDKVYNSADTFWKINTNSGEKKRIVELADMKAVVDSVDLVLDAEEKFLFFVNRRDKSLWKIDL